MLVGEMRICGAVLAAGRGERMRIDVPKPLFPLLGRPMIEWPLAALRGAGITTPVVVTSPRLKPALAAGLPAKHAFAIQPVPLGTGDAVDRTRALVRGPGVLVVINADSPLFQPGHVRALLAARASAKALVAFATATVANPTGLGRVLRDPSGQVANIVEENEASPAVRQVREINAGLYAFETPAIFDLLRAIPPAGPKGERYLTRAVELAIARGGAVATVAVPAESSGGVNTLAEAAYAQSILQARVLAGWMAQGVIVDDPLATWVEAGVTIAPGARLLPGTRLEGRTAIGPGCVIGPHAVIRDSRVGARTTVRSSTITGATIGDRCAVGPYAHIRPGSRLGTGVAVGTGAEVNRSTLAAGVRMHHFSYLGDAVVGRATNIGAGAITANYDGKAKHPTRIGNRAFIGSGAVLVAPAKIGDNAVVGAGAVVPGGRTVAPRTVVAGVPARVLDKSRKASSPKGARRAKRS